MISRSPHTASIYQSDLEAGLAEGEAEMLYIANLASSAIYTVQGVGLTIWELLESPLGPDELLSEITDIYGVDRETVAQAVFDFLGTMAERGLLGKA